MANGNRVHGNIGGKQKLNSLIEAVLVPAGIIPVRNQENSFAAIASTALEHFSGGVNSIIEAFRLRRKLGAEGRRRAIFKRVPVGGGASGERASVKSGPGKMRP